MRSRLKILVVEDDDANRRFFTHALTNANWEVASVASAEDALLELVGLGPIDALLIDKNLPGMDGIELVRRVRKTDKRVMCAIITGYASAASASEALHLGIDAYIEKPVLDIFTTVEHLRALVARRQASLAQPVRAGHLCAVVASPDAEICRAVVELLQGHCDGIEAVDSSATALAVVERTGARVLFLDAAVTNPTVSELLRQQPTRPFTTVVLTNPNTPLLQIVEYVDHGVVGMVEKPIDARQFEATTAELLAELRSRS